MALGKQRCGVRHLIPETQKEFARQLQRLRGGNKKSVYQPGLTLESAGRLAENMAKTPITRFKRTSESSK